MKDQFEREITYLRVSVTDRCNLRCVYCMPENGIEQVEHQAILTLEELLRVCKICADQGISKIKITGGEPLVRKGLDEFVKKLKQIDKIQQVTLTTNGILLANQIEALVTAGLDAVNISLDTLDAKQYVELTRRDLYEEAMSGVRAALSYPNLKVKLNCVILKGTNEKQVVSLAKMAKDHKLDVRFIEMMPIGMGKTMIGCSQREVCEMLETEFGSSTVLAGDFGNGPATYVSFPHFKGKVGFISAMSHKFCENCNRIRLSSEGFLKPCLHFASGVNVREIMREGVEDYELSEKIGRAIYGKPYGHEFQLVGEQREGRNQKAREECWELRQMSGIGG